MATVHDSDYESLRDSVINTYDALELTAVNVNKERLDHKNQAELTEEDGKTLKTRNKLYKKRICTVVIVTVVALLVIALAVMVYVFVSSKKEGKVIETGHCPKYSTNGTVVKATGSSYGDTIELTCDKKSKLNGPNVITCLSTGNWSESSQCVQKLCNNIQLSENMTVESEIESFTVGTTVTINCKEGFVVTGNHTVVCLSNEQWSANPTCNVIDCGIPESVANAVITNISETTYNSIFFVECKEGYIMSGSNIVKCNLYGEWDSMPTCKKVSCGLPTIPGNGSISQISGTLFQATASLKCDEGFLLIGEPIINCLSNGTWSNIPTCQFGNFTDCFNVLHQGRITQDGVYNIRKWKSLQHIKVYCDMTTDGGGWTVFQNRFDGSVDFYRNFSEYQNGFGDIHKEFWLGLENLHELVSQGQSELRIDISSANGSEGHVTFQNFSISSGSNYRLQIALGKGTIRDSTLQGLSFNNNGAFSTFDHDMDTSPENCALNNKGAWWYTRCMNVHLNGMYCTPGTTTCGYKGMIYYGFLRLESLLTSRMMFRRI